MEIQHGNIVLCSQLQTHICEFLQQIQIRLIPQSPGISCNGGYQYRIDTPCLILFDIAAQIRLIAVPCLQLWKLLIIVTELVKYIIAGSAVLFDHRIMSLLAERICGQSRMRMVRHGKSGIQICRKHLSPATVTGTGIIGIISGLIRHCGISCQIYGGTIHLFHRKSTDSWSVCQHRNVHGLIRKNMRIPHRYNIADIHRHGISELSCLYSAAKSKTSSAGKDQYLSHLFLGADGQRDLIIALSGHIHFEE